jgi:beta-glucosidase-like glycosyl hydrolase
MDQDSNSREPEINEDRAVVAVQQSPQDARGAVVSPRMLFVPMAVALVIGLAVGFSVGYGYGINQPPPEGPTETAERASDTPDVGVTATSDAVRADSEAAETAAPIEPPSEHWPARYMIITIAGETLTDAEHTFISEMKPGAVLLRGSNITSREQAAALIQSIKEVAGYGGAAEDLPLIAIEQPVPDANPLGFTQSPGIAELGEGRDAGRARAVAKDYAQTLRELGVAIVLGPPLAVATDEVFDDSAGPILGTDNAVVTAIGLAFADSLMIGGILPIATQFPAIAAANGDGIPVIEADIPVLARQMFPFSEAMSRGIPGILAEHVAVRAFDPGAEPRPASISPPLLNELARKQWQYKGVIVAADVAAPVLADAYTPSATAVAALAAGADAFIVGQSDPALFDEIAIRLDEAMADGTLDSARMTAARERLDAWVPWLRQPTGLEGPLPRVPRREPVADEAVVTEVPEEDAEEISEEEPAADAAVPAGEKIVHRIERGETLSSIARTYGVSAQNIMMWNELEDANIKFGFNLDIYPGGMSAPALDEDAAEEADTEVPEPATGANSAAVETAPDDSDPVEANEPTEAEGESAADVVAETAVAEDEPADDDGLPEPVPQPEGTQRIEHEVMPGEVLSRIALRYGVPMRSIMEWTGFTNPNVLAGQVLVIYVPEDSETPGDEAESDSTEASEEPDAAPEIEVAPQDEVSPGAADADVAPGGDPVDEEISVLEESLLENELSEGDSETAVAP